MTLPPGYVLHAAPPAVADYLRLRRETGLRPRTTAQAAAVLVGSWSACHVTAPDGTAAAMGRIVGDGGWYFVVADMATSPGHQRRGLGRAVLDHLLADVARRAPDDAYVSLTTEAAGRALYQRAGFTPLSPDQTGMQLVLADRATP